MSKILRRIFQIVVVVLGIAEFAFLLFESFMAGRNIGASLYYISPVFLS